MKITTYTIFLFLFFSCQQSQEKAAVIISEPTEIVSIQEDTIPAVAKKVEECKILLPRAYRDWENENMVNELNKDWFDLYQQDGKYYLGKAAYTIERGYDACSGDSTQIIKSKTKALLLIGFTALTIGEVYTVKITKDKIWPTESFKFNFGEDSYSLRAEGDVRSSEEVYTDNGLAVYHQVENYKLYLTHNDIETLFLEQAAFNDTFVELHFIGDLDQDGKPDFIFGANRYYEEERVILYLSSNAKEGKLIEKMAEVVIQFDC